MKFNLFSSNKKIVFVYSKEYRNNGSTVMRGKQLSALASNTFGSKADVYFRSSDNHFKNSFLFLTKGAIRSFSLQDLEYLHKEGNKIIMDPLDMSLTDDKAYYANIIIAASRTAFDFYQTVFPKNKIAIIDHHVDPRISQLDWSNSPKEFKIGYFGELFNTISKPSIRKKVDFIRIDTTKQDTKWLQKLPKYNMHYAIRKDHKNVTHKPFLKGFTAAFCRSNILIQDTYKEALYWLGEDYPYIIRGNINDKKIIDAIDQAKQSFGSHEWRVALERMQNIKDMVSPNRIGRQVSDAIAMI